MLINNVSSILGTKNPEGDECDKKTKTSLFLNLQMRQLIQLTPG